MGAWMTRLVLAGLWLFHWLPLPIQALCGWFLGHLLYVLVVPRRRVVQVNLRLCFPELSARQRGHWARQHFVAVARSFLERGVAWWASAARIRRLIRIEGVERLRQPMSEGRAVILVVPHFVGLDMTATRLALDFNAVTLFSSQLNKVLEAALLHGRGRFGDQLLLPRQEGIRGAVRGMREGRPFYYLPDLDYGPRESIFVPFFGIQTATIPGLSRMARLGDAIVLPFVVEMLPYGQGYVGRFSEAWQNFPTHDAEADTVRMNLWIEAEVRKMPTQYYWVHKRFKTRPPGEAKVY